MMEVLDIAIFITICIASFGSKNIMARTIYVTNFGAKGDGYTDDTDAFLNAWTSLCGDNTGNPTLIIPSGNTFVLRPVDFQGPCKSSRSRIHVQVSGTIIAPSSLNEWKNCAGSGKFWIHFSNVDNLHIDGSGKFNGRGSLWWWKNVRTQGCDHPSALHFNSCNGLQIKGTSHINSPKQHIGVHKCSNVDIGHLHISAPAKSHNTDGIGLSESTHVNIHDTFISTGDDCVAIKGGSYDVNVTGVNCGPGHGISVGSLGGYGGKDNVEQVRVVNCNLTSTTNGLRIKTVPGGLGYAKKILFQEIQLYGVKNPIIIDQHYCNPYLNRKCAGSSQVEVSSVTYKNVRGSSASKLAINLDCSDIVKCGNIKMDHVSITGSGVAAYCHNAQGTFISTSPTVKCN